MIASATDFTVFYGAGAPPPDVEEQESQVPECTVTSELLAMERQLAQRHGDSMPPQSPATIATVLGQADGGNEDPRQTPIIPRDRGTWEGSVLLEAIRTSYGSWGQRENAVNPNAK